MDLALCFGMVHILKSAFGGLLLPVLLTMFPLLCYFLSGKEDGGCVRVGWVLGLAGGGVCRVGSHLHP